MSKSKKKNILVYKVSLQKRSNKKNAEPEELDVMDGLKEIEKVLATGVLSGNLDNMKIEDDVLKQYQENYKMEILKESVDGYRKIKIAYQDLLSMNIAHWKDTKDVSNDVDIFDYILWVYCPKTHYSLYYSHKSGLGFKDMIKFLNKILNKIDKNLKNGYRRKFHEEAVMNHEFEQMLNDGKGSFYIDTLNMITSVSLGDWRQRWITADDQQKKEELSGIPGKIHTFFKNIEENKKIYNDDGEMVLTYKHESLIYEISAIGKKIQKKYTASEFKSILESISFFDEEMLSHWGDVNFTYYDKDGHNEKNLTKEMIFNGRSKVSIPISPTVADSDKMENIFSDMIKELKKYEYKT